MTGRISGIGCHSRVSGIQKTERTHRFLLSNDERKIVEKEKKMDLKIFEKMDAPRIKELHRFLLWHYR